MSGTTKKLRAAVVGATSLLGREVAEQLVLAEGQWDLTLLDEELAAGQMTSAGDEAAIIQPLTPGSLSDADVVFFACDAATAKTHWPEVQRSGALVIDLSGGLAGDGIVPSSPWIAQAPSPSTPANATLKQLRAVLPAHPVALLLGMVAQRLQDLGVAKLVATVLQPASQQGKAGLEELQSQTSALLTFQSVERSVYDADVAFNLLPALGKESKWSMADEAARIRREFSVLVPQTTLELQLIQAPVFHGFCFSVYLEPSKAATEAEFRAALNSGWLHVTSEDEGPASNRAGAEQESVLVTVLGDSEDLAARGVWLWIAVDNLRLAARHAVACATDMLQLGPASSIQ